MNRAKEYGKAQQGKIRKTVLPCIQGIKRFLTQVYIHATGNDNTKVFDNLEEAMEFLVSD